MTKFAYAQALGDFIKNDLFSDKRDYLGEQHEALSGSNFMAKIFKFVYVS